MNLSQSVKIFFLIMSFVCQVKAQIKIIDFESKNAIPFVEIFSQKGQLIGIADANGILSDNIIGTIKNANNADFTLNHMAYKEFVISKDELLKSTTIELTHKTWDLNEVVVKAKKKKYYLKITGYYRSYQLNDDALYFYVDGQVEFLYPPNQRKGASNKRLQERYYAILDKLNPKKGQTAIINSVGPAVPEAELNVEELRKEFEVLKEQEEAFTLKAKKSKYKTGVLSKNGLNKTVTYDIGYITPENEKKYKGFGLETIIKNKNSYAVFSSKELEKPNIAELMYYKLFIKLLAKNKNEDQYQNVETIREFFVTDVEYLEVKPKGFGNYTGVKRNSNYNKKFWEETKLHPLYQPLPLGIERSISENLVELKNKE